jgi:MFS family permease
VNKRRRIFYGWWVVVGLFIIGMFGPLGRYSMTAFFPFISDELGWPRSTIGLAQSLTLWVYSFFVLLSGSMVDRIGSRKTFLVGGTTTLAGWILLSTIKAPWQLFLYYGGVMALAVSMTHAVPVQSTNRKWFRKKAGLVTGITTAAFALSNSILMPVITGMADSQGWRSTSIVGGLVAGTVIILVALFLIRDTPESMGLHPDGENAGTSSEGSAIKEVSWTVKQAIGTSQLWLLFITYSVFSLSVNGVLSSLVMWGVDMGSAKATSGIFMTALTIPSIISKIGGGWLGDKYGKKLFILIGQICGVLVMLYGWQGVNTQQSLIVFAILQGIAYGMAMPLFSPYLGDIFGRAYVGSLFGIVTLGSGSIGGCGPLMWGMVYDTFGSYNVACLISAVCYAIAAITIFLVRPLEAKKAA